MKTPSSGMSYGQTVLIAFKLIIVPIGIGWVMYKAGSEGGVFATVWRSDLILAALVLNEVALWMLSVRLARILSIFSASLSTVEAFKINLQSLFYFLVVPTSLGMETLRYLRINQAVPQLSKTETVSALLLDRLIGVASALIIFAVAGWWTVPRLSASISFGYQLLLLPILIAGGIVMLTFAWSKWGTSLSGLVSVLLAARYKVLLLIAYGAAIQALTVLAIWFAANGLGFKAGLADIGWGVMGATVLMILPLSIAGLGAGELGGVALLIAVGSDHKTALAIIFLAYLGRVAGGIQGAVLEFLDGAKMLRQFSPHN